MKDTKQRSYTSRLDNSNKGLRGLVDVQWPYRRHLASLNLVDVLDVGCGIGRNLENLAKLNVPAVGVDHNEFSVEMARSRGLRALTTEQFKEKYDHTSDKFSSILISHVLEHMEQADAISIVKDYANYLKPEGRIIVITPQEAGFRSDPTHINFVDIDTSRTILETAGLTYQDGYSFPFPKFLGHIFLYNEFVVVGKK